MTSEREKERRAILRIIDSERRGYASIIENNRSNFIDEYRASKYALDFASMVIRERSRRERKKEKR